jgi:phosphatidylserine/phosphatidylglycerophosphate/cardiolipin synthase-like enzyme
LPSECLSQKEISRQAHARLEVVGSSALVGSSNFTYPSLRENIELNVLMTGRPVTVLQEWYEEHWNNAEDVTPEM